MSKLREKFRMYIDLYNEQDASESCEQITDDFAVKFAEWLRNLPKYQFKTKSATELLQIFKDKIYE